MIIRDNAGTHVIRFDDILYCSADGQYSEIHLIDGRSVKTSKTLKSIDEKLPKHLYYRIHQKTTINLSHIDGIKKEYVILSGGIQLPISRRNRKEFLLLFQV